LERGEAGGAIRDARPRPSVSKKRSTADPERGRPSDDIYRGMTSAAPARVLLVAHRPAATPRLLDEIRAHSGRSPCHFTLLVPRPYWDPETEQAVATLELAIPLLDEAAGGHVEGIVGDSDLFAAVEQALEGGGFDEIIISTHCRRPSRTGSAATSPIAWRRSACPSPWLPPSSPSAPSLTLAEPTPIREQRAGRAGRDSAITFPVGSMPSRGGPEGRRSPRPDGLEQERRG
jgi:hypothetical protein